MSHLQYNGYGDYILMSAYVTEQRYAVNCVRTNHNEHVVMVTVNGRAIAERVFVGRESLPRIMEINRLRKVFNCERWE